MKSITLTFKRMMSIALQIKFVLLFVLMGLLFTPKDLTAQCTPSVPAGTISLDGKPCEWPAIFTYAPITVKVYKDDPQNSSSDDTFVQGSSDVSPISGWTWKNTGSNDKNDMKNTGVALIGTKLYFFADRFSNGGDAQFGIWILRDKVLKTGTTTGGFTGEHKNGDILLRSHFINGGSVSDRRIFLWEGGPTGAPVEKTVDFPVGALNFIANSLTENVPAPWIYSPKSGAPGTYPANSFIEGFIDLQFLATYLGQSLDLCFASFLLETGQSQSINSSLEDIVSGSFGAIPLTQTLTGNTFCAVNPPVGTITMGSSEIGVNYQLYLGTPPTTPVQGVRPGTGNPIDWNNLPGGAYNVVATNTATNCETAIGPVTVTQNSSPACSITGNNNICPGSTNTYNGPPGLTGYNWSISGGASIPGSTTGPSVSVLAGPACGTFTLTLVVTDAIGCTSTCSQLFNVVDITPPVITCPAPPVSPISCPSVPVFGTATATDLCDQSVTITFADVDVPGSCPGTYTRTRTWTATDDCGNTATCSQSVVVRDITPPVITCPTAPTSPISCPAVPVFGTATATDLCDQSVTITFADVDVPGSCPGTYTRTRTWTATDDCGNTATCSQSVVVRDITPPVITCPAPPTSPISCPSVPVFGTATATDLCDQSVTITFADVDVPGSCPGTYTRTRTWTATDDCGNTATCSQSVVVRDITPPVITFCPPDVTRGGCNNVVEYLATATDECNNPPTITYSHPSGTAFPVGVTTVTVTATDACGNTATCSFTVTIIAIPVTVASNSGPICVGGTFTISATNSVPPGASYSWSGPDNFASAVQNPPAFTNATTAMAGLYTVTVTLNGCSSQSTTNVIIVENPILFVTVGSAFCVNDPNAPNAGSVTQQGSQLGVSYQLFDDAAVPIGAPQAGTGLPGQETLPANWIYWTGLPAGTYAAQATGSGPTACVTPQQQADVIENPIPNVTVRDTTVCANTGCFNLSLLFPSPAGGVWSGTGVSANGLQFCTDGLQPGPHIIIYTVSDENQCTSSANATVTINNCYNAICTYTQGAYGSPGGTMCNGTINGITTAQYITQSINNWGGTLMIGKPGRSVVMTNAAADVACVIAKMPGGGGSKELSVLSDVNICNLPSSYLKNGKIFNQLLSQTIALGLNVGTTSPSTLGSFALQAGVLATAEPLGGCGSNTPKIRVCNYNPIAPYELLSVTNEYRYRTITQAIVDAIIANSGGPATVQGLLQLADSALANADGIVSFEKGVSLTAIADAVARINEVFDECRIFIGWNVAPCAPNNPNPPQVPFTQNTTTSVAREITTTVNPTEMPVAKINVTAYPNPFTDQVRFVITSPVSGRATLEVYNMLGTKLQVVYNGYVFAGKGQVIEYRVPALNRTNLVYILRVDNRIVTGKLTNVR